MADRPRFWKYVPHKRGTNYALIQYSLGKTKATATPETAQWSKPIRVGSKKFKNMLLFGKLNIDDFPQYRISDGGRYGSYVYFDQNHMKNVGKNLKINLLNDNKSMDTMISYDLMFYVPISEIQKLKAGKKGYRLDLYSHAMKEMRWNGRVEKAYPMFHRKFHFISKKQKLVDFFKRFKNPFELRNNRAYSYFWNTFASGTNIGIERNAIDSIADIGIGYFDNIREVPPQQLDKLNYKSAVAMDDFFMNCQNFLQMMEQDDDPIYPLHADDTSTYYPKNGCLYVELMKTYKESIDNASKKNPKYKKFTGFCYEKMWNIIHGEKPLPDNDDADAWGLSWDQACKFFDYFQIEASLISAFDGKVKCHYTPKSITKKISPKHFRYVWSNNHCWRLDKCGQELWSKKLQYTETIVEDDVEDEVVKTRPYNFQYPTDNSHHLLLNSVDEIAVFLNTPDPEPSYYTIITNLCLEKVFLELLHEHKIMCKIVMGGCSFNRLQLEMYYNKNITIKQSFHPQTSQVFIDDIQDYNGMNDYLLKIKKIMFQPRFSSFYSPQVYRIFQTFRKGGINCQFNTNMCDEFMVDDEAVSMCGMSDFNRFYTSELLRIDYFPIFNFDCYFEDYHDEPLEDLNLYYVRKTNKKFVYPFYQDDLCYGINLKKADTKNFVIQKVMRPSSYFENPLRDMFRELYSSSLPDDVKKNVGNILCGLLQQKSSNKSKTFYSNNIQEINYIQDTWKGGNVFPLLHNDQESWLITKNVSSPLLNGFYPLGLMVLDGTQQKMDVLITRLHKCGLKPFAIKTDCVYHDINPTRYDNFIKQYPDYFDYTDKNDFTALGKLKYDMKRCGVWNKHDFKTFDFDFTSATINNIKINDEWNLDEFCHVIENNSSLFVFGHGGYGKSHSIVRACEKMNKKIIILTKTHPLSDKYYAEKKEHGFQYECFTAEKFFKLSPFSDIPFGYNNYSKMLDGVYAVVLDDALLCNTKIFTQWLIFRNWVRYNRPLLKLIGNGDPLQLDMVFNDENNSFKNFDGNKYDKLTGMMSRMFENVVCLQYNKRLRSLEDRSINKKFIEVCKSGNFDEYMKFATTHMNVVKSIFDIPYSIRKNIRNVIVARNRDRFQFNKSCFAWEHGNYKEQFQVGHLVMSNKSVFALKFSSFQLFTIVKKGDENITLKNILKDDHLLELKMDVFQKYFGHPYSRTCHSWQGMTCDGVLVIYGFHHLYNDMSWFYTADSRITDFKNIYHVVDEGKMSSCVELKNKLQDRIDGYYRQDMERGMNVDMSRYIDVCWIECELRRCEYLCSYCKTDVWDGWTIDRLNSNLPHYRSNCCVACVSCNCGKRDRL